MSTMYSQHVVLDVLSSWLVSISWRQRGGRREKNVFCSFPYRFFLFVFLWGQVASTNPALSKKDISNIQLSSENKKNNLSFLLQFAKLGFSQHERLLHKNNSSNSNNSTNNNSSSNSNSSNNSNNSNNMHRPMLLLRRTQQYPPSWELLLHQQR